MMFIGKRICSLTFRQYVRSRRSAFDPAIFIKCAFCTQSCKRLEGGSKAETPTFRIRPQTVLPQSKDIEFAIDLCGEICPNEVTKLVEQFLSRSELTEVISKHGMDDNMLSIIKESFKRHCSTITNLPENLYIIMSDLIKGQGNIMDILPYFKEHIFHVYPHLQYLDELKRVGDFQDPVQWYPAARSMKRKLIFHHGPTNSGKTHYALKRYMEAKSAIYCAPLKLLATQIYEKANKGGVPCDLVTGDDKRYAVSVDNPAEHVSCSVEMADFKRLFEVAVIDEVQMIKCPDRGHAWTSAILGICAKEIHLCGETAAVNYLKGLAKRMGEEIECIKYERLTKLTVEDKAVEDLRKVQKGDCIVCFQKTSIFKICTELYSLGIRFAVIYGSLPPSIKTREMNIFNDEKNSTVLVATDAIGMGLNLNIRRIIFWTIRKNKELISVSQALQIAGRAGRFGSCYKEGFVTTFSEKDLPLLKELLSQSPEEVTQAGLYPTLEQMETFSYYLPELKFGDLLDVFISLATVNEFYFLCDVGQMKRLALIVQYLEMSPTYKYLFCTAPVDKDSNKAVVAFTQYAKMFAAGTPVKVPYLIKMLQLPETGQKTLSELEDLEVSFDCLEMYTWFANRIPLIFPDIEEVRKLQVSVAILIYRTIGNILKEAKARSKTASSNNEMSKPSEYKGKRKQVLER